MSRVANAGFIGFSFELDWPPHIDFDPKGIKIDVTLSRNIVQLPEQRRHRIVEALTSEVREHIAAGLVVDYPVKLREVTPGPEYCHK